ncbi:MarR family winged helix-turn-helix transcriptional regulator [Streptomyces erythrochromogenes]|uniref:MarR family winged helix-turn-helix transcriptional regulator n=1 Tax=Streptomyces erythrochromogenes TaxID=285574 RepID=UPI003684E54A
MPCRKTKGAAVPARLRELPSRLLGQASTHTQRLVADALGRTDARKWHYAAMVAVINELAERELVERAPDPEDRRRNVITLTPLGRRRLHRLEQILDTAQDELLAPLSAAEREQLTRLLSRIVEHHAYGGPAMGPDGQ